MLLTVDAEEQVDSLLVVAAEGTAAGADDRALVSTQFAGRKLKVAYQNPDHLPWGMYTIAGIRLDGEPLLYERQGEAAFLPRRTITDLAEEGVHALDVSLATNTQE